MKRTLSGHTTVGVAVLCAATLILLSGCARDGSGTASSAGSSGPSIWYVNPLPSTPDWGRSGKLFMSSASKMGYQGKLLGPSQLDPSAMVSDIEQAVTSGAKGIITCPLNPSTFKTVIDSAQAKGIVVASIGCVDPNADFSVGTGNIEYGKNAADLIAQQTQGQANVGIIGTDQTTPNQVATVQGFRAQVKAKYPNIKEVAWESDNSDAAVAAQKIPAMLAANPDINYLWIIEGAAPAAVPSALKEANKEPGDVKVLAIDAQAPTLKAIQDGWITTTFNQCWFDASDNIAVLIKKMIEDDVQPRSFYSIPVEPVSKADLPYQGCQKSEINAVFNKS